jgi:hypothetical protein
LHFENRPIERNEAGQAQRFVALNRQVLSEYWHYRIDTDELRQRLQSIKE